MKHEAVSAFVVRGAIYGLCSCGAAWVVMTADGESRDYLEIHIKDPNRK